MRIPPVRLLIPALAAWLGAAHDAFGPTPDADTDGDGQGDWVETWVGTDPTNPRSRLAPIERLSADTFRLSWPSRWYPDQSIRAFRVLARDRPDAGPWNERIVLVAPGVDRVLRHTVHLPPGTDAGFYRVVADENPLGMVWIPPGTYLMGSPPTEPARAPDEGPQTSVTISRGFWLGRHEVTQREYLAVTGTNPSGFTGDLDRPVELVSWLEAADYCARLTARERSTGRLPYGYEYRLPTEAQWEYACRAETVTATALGNRLGSTQANFDGRYPYNGGAVGPNLVSTTRVESYPPNAWGLYDMHGNVWEWCQDWYDQAGYSGGSATDPLGPHSGSVRVLRGGSWNSFGQFCRSASRYRNSPEFRYVSLGLRAALVAVP